MTLCGLKLLLCKLLMAGIVLTMRVPVKLLFVHQGVLLLHHHVPVSLISQWGFVAKCVVSP